MAERRMFAKSIVLSDAFLDMPLSARCLYFTLNMLADDDGFVNNPKSIMRQCGTQEDDLKILLVKKFLLAFESGVIVIKHWKVHNYIQKDRYKTTKYIEEKSLLELDNRCIYSKKDECIQNVYNLDTQVRLGKDRLELGKDSINNNTTSIVIEDEQQTKTKKFIKPTIEEIKSYCNERKNDIDAGFFYDYYESKGWQIGKNPMKDWKAAVRTWERKNFNKGGDNNAETSTNSRRNPNESKYSRENGWF